MAEKTEIQQHPHSSSLENLWGERVEKEGKEGRESLLETLEKNSVVLLCIALLSLSYVTKSYPNETSIFPLTVNPNK